MPETKQVEEDTGLTEAWAKKILVHFRSCLIDWGGDPTEDEYKLPDVRRIDFGFSLEEDLSIVIPVDDHGDHVGFDIIRFMKLFAPSAGCNFNDTMDGPTTNFNGELLGRKGTVWIMIHSYEHGPSMPNRYLPKSKRFYFKD